MPKFNQRLTDEITPDDESWKHATQAERLAYFKRAGKLAVPLKRSELSRAIGANGRRMAPRKRPRPDGAAGPVLTPHRDDSRTMRLLDAHADPRGMTLYWRSGHSNVQRLPWGTILGFHARGEVKGAPARDVRLSKRGINALRVEMVRWWQQQHAEKVEARERERVAAQAEEEHKAARSLAIKAGKAASKAKRAVAEKYKGLAGYLKPPNDRRGF